MVFFNSSVLSDPPEDLRQSSELVPAADQRFAMRMSRQLFDSLWILSKKEEIPRADIVRRALGLYAKAVEAKAKSQIIAFVKICQENSVEVVRLLKLDN